MARGGPGDGAVSWSLSCAGCPSLMGMNEHGLVIGTTNLSLCGGQPGVGYMDLTHRALMSCRDHDAAIEVIRAAPRAAAHSYIIADQYQASIVEASADNIFCHNLDLDNQQPIAISNHCLTAELQSKEVFRPPHPV